MPLPSSAGALPCAMSRLVGTTAVKIASRLFAALVHHVVGDGEADT